MADDKIRDWRKYQVGLMLECMIDASAVQKAFLRHTECGVAPGHEFITRVGLEFYHRRIRYLSDVRYPKEIKDAK